MKHTKKLATAITLLSFAAAGSASATAQNVALNKAVTLNGVFAMYGWDGATTIAASTVTDGAYLATSTQWDHAMWWDAGRSVSAGSSIQISLGGPFSLNQFALQADNNDGYLIEYLSHGSWHSAWQANAVSGWGLANRGSSVLPAIVTDTLRITGTGGDRLYSVGEFQAFGVSAVPESSTYAMLLAGLGLIGFTARRQRARQAN
ncbi:MAG: PEP-CTERM sorting domain-containing protein [Pseudomonadota bacterium]